MAKKRSIPRMVGPALTQERAARLVRLLNLLGGGPITRAGLTRRLGLGIRGFYRDLEVLRAVGIEVALTAGRYVLQDKAEEAIERLPFPDPGLSLGEARQLSKGRTPAHRKIKSLLESIEQ